MSKAGTTTGSALSAFIRRRRGAGERLYAVVDSARDGELADKARETFGRDVKSLFADDAGAHMESVAPYMVPIEANPRLADGAAAFLDLWAKHLGNSAGVLLLTTAEPDRVRVHLRGVFRATDEDDHKYYFRFYDPRVLRPFLPACTAGDAREFFGPVSQVLVEAESEGKMLCCKPGPEGVALTEAPLNRPSGASRRPGR